MARTRGTRLAALALANVLLPVAVLVFASGFFPFKPLLPGLATFQDDAGTNGNTQAGGKDEQAVFDRVVFMVVDALRSDFVYGHNSGFEFTQCLIRDGAAIPFTAHATPPTVTMPRIKAITTGSVPSFADLIFNLDESDTGSSLAGQDTWLAQIRAKGGKLVFYGDDTWLRLFPGADFFARAEGTSSFFVTDYTEVDFNVTRHVPQELGKSDWNSMILHYLGLDHIGHKTGPQGPNMLPKQSEMDAIVKMIYQAMETQEHHKDTLLVLLGDHGMNGAGNHGGSGPGETEPALLFASPKLKNRKGRREYECPTLPKEGTEFHFYTKIEQSDIVPTLAGLMHMPISKNSLGVVIDELKGLWSGAESYDLSLRQNAQQIGEILEATFGQEVLRSRVLAREQRLGAGEHMPCADNEGVADELACCLVTAEHHLALSKQTNEWSATDAAYIRFLTLAQEVLSTTASSYNIPHMAAGMLIAAFALLSSSYSFGTLWPPSVASVVFTLMSVLYGVMMFASSYVEEEQHFWYWLTPTWIALLSAKSLTHAYNTPARYRVAIAAVLILAVHRIAIRWNQTGQKHAGESDIVHTFFLHHHNLMWVLVLATYCYNGVALIQYTLADILPTEIATIVATALVVPAFVFKLNFTNADAPELVQELASQIIEWTAAFDLVMQAQLAFVILALVTVGVSVLAVGLARTTVISGPDGPSVRITLPERLHYLLTLFLMTQSRAPNIPLFLGLELQRKALRVLLRPDTQGNSAPKRNSDISAVQLATSVLLLSHTYFFCIGGSNSISSVDLSNAYNGVGNYNIVAVGMLLFSANWTGPIWWCSAAVLLTFSKPSRPLLPPKPRGGREWIEEERTKIHQEAIGDKKDSGQADVDVWLLYISSMTAFIAASLVAVMASCTALRTHLFIWTVFSPKYLYAMAWGVGWHLLVNIGLGSGLRGLGQIA